MMTPLERHVSDSAKNEDGVTPGRIVSRTEMGEARHPKLKVITSVMGGVGCTHVLIINVYTNIGDGAGTVTCVGALT